MRGVTPLSGCHGDDTASDGKSDSQQWWTVVDTDQGAANDYGVANISTSFMSICGCG